MGRRSEMGINDDQFDGRQMFLYVEYGLRERLTLVTQVNVGVLTDEDAFVRMETTGIGDLDVGLKYQLVDSPLVVSPMLSLKIPTGYDDAYDPALGTGKLDAEGQLLVSRSLYPLPLYAGVEVGYRLRGGAFSNQWSWSTEVGATPHARVFAKAFAAQTSTLVSFNDEDLGVVDGSTQVSEGDFTNLGVNIAVEVVSGLWLDGLLEKTIDGEHRRRHVVGYRPVGEPLMRSKQMNTQSRRRFLRAETWRRSRPSCSAWDATGTRSPFSIHPPAPTWIWSTCRWTRCPWRRSSPTTVFTCSPSTARTTIRGCRR